MLAPLDLDAIDRVTDYLIAEHNLRLCLLYQFGADLDEHIEIFAQLARIPPGGRVVDLGSGVGEVSRLLQKQVPGATFSLVNLSSHQHYYAPEWMEKHACDLTSVPLPSASFDSALAIFSFSQCDLDAALREAFRLLIPGGTLLVYDVLRLSGDNSRLDRLCCQARTRDEVADAAMRAGFSCEAFYQPTNYDYTIDDTSLREQVLQEFEGTGPGLWQLIKPAVI